MNDGLVGRAGALIKKNAPVLLTGTAVTGLVTAVVSAIIATPKALYLLQEEESSRLIQSDGENTIEFTAAEIVALTWRCYIPTIAVSTLTIACIVGAHSIQMRRNALLLGLWSIAEQGLHEYRRQLVKVVGPRKADEVEGEYAQALLNSDPVQNKAIIFANKEESLIYDSYSGRYFKKGVEDIRQAINEFNRELITQGVGVTKPLNDFYYLLGLEPIDSGNEAGFSVDHILEVNYSAKLATDGTPCMVLVYSPYPGNI